MDMTACYELHCVRYSVSNDWIHIKASVAGIGGITAAGELGQENLERYDVTCGFSPEVM